MKESVESKLRFNNNLTFWSLWIMIVGLFICQAIINIDTRNELNSIQEEIDSMPHYECWNQTTEKWITLQARECTEDENFWAGISCLYNNGASISYDPETDEVECEDMVIISDYYNEIYNSADQNKTCVIKTTKEVCQLNRNDVLLGDKE